ncbi:MAG: hypothetical protein ABJN35_09095 [Erythrobacter sp.]
MALTACGSENSGTFTTEDGETGEYTIDQDSGAASMTIDTPDGEVSMRSGAAVDVDLPDGFTIVDGAEVLSTTIIDQADSKGALVTFNTDRTPDQVVEHFRAQAEAAGIDIQIETSINGGRMLGGESPSGTTFSITAYPAGENGDSRTNGQLVLAKGGS